MSLFEQVLRHGRNPLSAFMEREGEGGREAQASYLNPEKPRLRLETNRHPIKHSRQRIHSSRHCQGCNSVPPEPPPTDVWGAQDLCQNADIIKPTPQNKGTLGSLLSPWQ